MKTYRMVIIRKNDVIFDRTDRLPDCTPFKWLFEQYFLANYDENLHYRFYVSGRNKDLLTYKD